MDDLIDAISAQAPLIAQLEERENDGDERIMWVQAGALRSALDIANDAYYSYRLREYYDMQEWREPVEFGRELLRKKAP
jgi:hypothetical protein